MKKEGIVKWIVSTENELCYLRTDKSITWLEFNEEELKSLIKSLNKALKAL